MLHIYKSDAQGSLLTVKEITHNSLVYLENPSAAEIQSTAKTLNIPLISLKIRWTRTSCHASRNPVRPR